MAELGYLQLCSDRRFHRKTMLAFEQATGLAPDEYWIEAAPGGAPGFAGVTRLARIAYDSGARHMGWAAHGDQCRAYPGISNDELRRKLAGALRERAEDFGEAIHYELFGAGDEVSVMRWPG